MPGVETKGGCAEGLGQAWSALTVLRHRYQGPTIVKHWVNRPLGSTPPLVHPWVHRPHRTLHWTLNHPLWPACSTLSPFCQNGG